MFSLVERIVNGDYTGGATFRKLCFWFGLCIGILVLFVVLEAFGVLDAKVSNLSPNWELAKRVDTGVSNTDISKWVSRVRRSRIFKPATPLPTRSRAQQTVDRILGRLTLLAVMEQDGEPVAYINIKDMGMRAFHAGDSVEDMFTIRSVKSRSVVLDIIGEIIELEL
jgi:hypothetical protein